MIRWREKWISPLFFHVLKSESRKEHKKMKQGFNDIIAKVKECGKKTVSVSVAQDSAVLEAVKAAKERNIADAILVGDEAKIREIAASINMDLEGFEIINEPDDIQASLTAVKLAHDGKADMCYTISRLYGRYQKFGVSAPALFGSEKYAEIGRGGGCFMPRDPLLSY